MTADPLRVWNIEGEALTVRAIACRMGISTDAARRRIEAVLADGDGITWRRLRSKGRK